MGPILAEINLNHISRPSWHLKRPVGAYGCRKQHELLPRRCDGTIGFSDDAYHISRPSLKLKPSVGACGCLKQHEMAPKFVYVDDLVLRCCLNHIRNHLFVLVGA